MSAADRQRRYRDRKRRRVRLAEFEADPGLVDVLVDIRVISREDAENKVALGHAFREAFRRLLTGRLLGG